MVLRKFGQVTATRPRVGHLASNISYIVHLTGGSLLAPALVVGLFGGTVYIQTCLAIDRELPRRERELALATISVGSPIGILLADISGLVIQWCLFAYLGIPSAGGACPFSDGSQANVSQAAPSA